MAGSERGTEYDVVIVGSGPNGLAAGIELARAGLSVVIYEAKETIGGGARTMEVTLPGFYHDICSAIHPLGVGSPFFRNLPLHEHGLQWIYPDFQLAHPFDDGQVGLLHRRLEETVPHLDPDGEAYLKLMKPFADRWPELASDILGPLPIPPKHPLLMARFGLVALRSTKGLVNSHFKGKKAKALFAGMAAHAFIPLDHIATASFGMVLGILAHALGWAIPKGGSQQIINAMAGYFAKFGGKIVTGTPIKNIDELPKSRAVLFDLTPRQIVKIAGHKLPTKYCQALERYRYGPGIFKIDWALSEPVPWKSKECSLAGTVHLGNTYDEIAATERDAWEGRIPEKPLILYAQQSTFDPSRAPEGKHTGWAYCHVPHGSTVDMTERIENQIERFAPGFRDLILHRTVMNSAQVEAYNPNYIGGDINGGVQDLGQLFTRPMLRRNPYSTPLEGVYICSASTPPGGGVHGMCGYYAAHSALHDVFGK